ncbi:MAG TPA: hypothetical protein VK194_07710 [Candidatus Deferrimicrobium sp.]|nr:hypothetical protein [Candidatus Deferrimicrobium sp.]
MERLGHNATRVRADGPLVEGGTVFVRPNYGRTYPCRIRRLVPDRALELEVRPPLMRIINVYEVEPATGGSRLRHALEVSGPIGCVARWVGLGRFYERLLDREVARVAMIAAETAQARARASREAP